MKGLFVAVSLLLGGFASAKPIVWYHFNEKVPGGKCSSGDQTIVNAAKIPDAADMNGTVKGILWAQIKTDDWGGSLSYVHEFAR